jgi:hypothetical protein
MKEVACMAANGDEASISMWMIRGGSTVPKPSWFNQLLYSRGFRCRESGSRVSTAELRLQKAELEDDSESWRWQVQQSRLYNFKPSTTWRGEVEVGGGLLGCQRHRGPGSARFWFAGSRRGSRWWRPVGVSIVSRPVVVEEVHASGAGRRPFDAEAPAEGDEDEAGRVRTT